MLSFFRRSTAVRTAPPDLSRDREMVERELDALLPESRNGNTVADAMRYSVLGGGQRIRPILALRVARLLGRESPAVLRAAAATELVHCASLIVDDLPCMDDSPLRRDRPSAHVAFGEANAILTAFAMVALAARSTMDPIAANGSAARLSRFQWNLLGVLDPASLIQGQSLDLDSPAPAQSALITELKTVPLFELAVEAGGVSSPEYDRRESEFRDFARRFGRAFQAVDDYLDGDLADRSEAAAHVDLARQSAFRIAGRHSHDLTELIDYLHAKLTEDRCYR